MVSQFADQSIRGLDD